MDLNLYLQWVLERMYKMIKRSVIRLLLIGMLAFSMPISVSAKSSDLLDRADVLDTQLQHIVSSNSISKVRGAARGRVLSSVELQLSDEGSGVIGVYAETLCHTAVKEIYMTIYLDVWDDNLQDWVMVDNYEYNWKASDNPNESLTDVSVSFSLEGLPRGRMYSLRGAHAAKNFNNVSEVMSSATDGIVLG